jgi:hemerythrin HHE cation binding domain-containing protein
MSTSFSDLLEVHSRLDDLFLEHQRALLRLDLPTAKAALDAYQIELLAHMRDEEELMLPIYQERATAPVGGAAEIFNGEHEKLRQYVSLFVEALRKFEGSNDLEKDVLWLLDSQTTFKRLHVHHDTREKKMLYPLLDKVTSGREREEIFTQLKLKPTVKEACAQSA